MNKKSFELLRMEMFQGTKPVSEMWGRDRGLALHRFYLEKFLAEYHEDIQGHCLEFQNPEYTNRFGKNAVKSLDILHIDDSNPQATITGDVTKENNLPSNAFDCIVCTHVLHVVFDFCRAIQELHRMLRPGGVLLVAVPQVSMNGLEYEELWRFTPLGLKRALETAFDHSNILVKGYGNSLTSAAELRGIVCSEFSSDELESNDERFSVEVCARAQK